VGSTSGGTSSGPAAISRSPSATSPRPRWRAFSIFCRTAARRASS
jgi:hypothetical protein